METSPLQCRPRTPAEVMPISSRPAITVIVTSLTPYVPLTSAPVMPEGGQARRSAMVATTFGVPATRAPPMCIRSGPPNVTSTMPAKQSQALMMAS